MTGSFIPARDLVYSHLSPVLLGLSVTGQGKVAECTQWAEWLTSPWPGSWQGEHKLYLPRLLPPARFWLLTVHSFQNSLLV